ncbi:hypothetical protein MKW98_031061 [Papaver atlanticum]|uniref:Uncharacterized protein n=1 Tax=Papaver atlanticum TaxID=357466 RepID=A0AAD4SUT2_9MAGN|nr:hypothetical protein MKW98_031061 [Papaver atlanticum]
MDALVCQCSCKSPQHCNKVIIIHHNRGVHLSTSDERNNMEVDNHLMNTTAKSYFKARVSSYASSVVCCSSSSLGNPKLCNSKSKLRRIRQVKVADPV